MRRVLIAITIVAALMLPGCTSDNGTTPEAATATPPQWTPVPGLPLEEPEQVTSDKGVLEVKLTARTDAIDVSGDSLRASPINDRLGGPTLRVHPGDTIKVTFVNDLGEGRVTNIHYHGLHVSPLGTSDNVFRTFEDGKTYQSEVHLPADHPTGTYWYHAHMHHYSDEQVMGGFSGILIVEGLEALLPPGWSGIPQRQLGLRDVQTLDGAVLPEHCPVSNPSCTTINPNQPSTRLLNSLYQPTFEMKSNQYELWRLANIGADAFYQVQFDGHELAVIAEDGVPVWNVVKAPMLLLPPGKRFDVLVLGGTAGTYNLQSLPYASHSTALNPATPQTLATVTVTASSDPVTPAGDPPTSLTGKDHDLSNAQNVIPRPPFVFSYTGPGEKFQALINGVAFSDGMVPPVSPILNTVEEWTLQNTTNDDHPFHIHVNGFQVMSVNGQPYAANGHQDIVNIPKQSKQDPNDPNSPTVPGQVVIRNAFKDFPGWFVYHCHILNHEDFGMMATIQVRTTPDEPITPPPGTSEHHEGS